MNATGQMFDIAREGEVVIVTPLYDLRELEFQQIQEELRSLSGLPSLRKVVIDFARTDYLGSTALGMLIYLWKRLKERGGRMVLCNISAHEAEIFDLVGFTGLWKIYPSREEAVQALTA